MAIMVVNVNRLVASVAGLVIVIKLAGNAAVAKRDIRGTTVQRVVVTVVRIMPVIQQQDYVLKAVWLVNMEPHAMNYVQAALSVTKLLVNARGARWGNMDQIVI